MPDPIFFPNPQPTPGSAPNRGDAVDNIGIRITRNHTTDGKYNVELVGRLYDSVTGDYTETIVNKSIPNVNDLFALNPEMAQAFGAISLALKKVWEGTLVYPTPPAPPEGAPQPDQG